MRRNSRVFKKCVVDGRCRNEKCAHPWYCEYWKGGQRYRLSIPKAFPDEDANPKTKTEASTVWLPKFISEVNQALAEGRKPFVKAPKPLDVDTLTVAEFIDQHFVPRYYQAKRIEEIKSPDGRSKMKLLRADLGDLRLTQLESETVVDDYKKRLMASGNIVACNRRLSKLRQMLNWARDWKFIAHVPFSRNLVSLHTDLEVGRERRLLPGEEEALLAAADRARQCRQCLR